MLLENGECCWSWTTLKGWIWYTTTDKGNNNKNPRRSKSMERRKMCWKVGAEEREVPLITRVLMQSCKVFARSPKKSLRKCSREIGIEKSSVHRILNMPPMIFCYQQSRRYVALFDVVVWIVLWQKLDILKIYGLEEVYEIGHNPNCISVSFRCWEITLQRVFKSIWDIL